MKIEKFINSIFTSNSYILYSEESDYVFVIDPGDSDIIIEWLEINNKLLKGIIITHSHFDHIYGINNLMERYPEITIYASFYSKEGMKSEKLNGSYYQEIPFTINHLEITFIKENDKIQLWNGVTLFVFDTPGHDRDCLSFHVEKNVFTGDSLIPGIKIHTKSKYSNKILAEESVKKIKEKFDNNTIIWPGHGESCLLETLK